MEINFLYRISDAGNPKLKLDCATKMNCLDNFLKEFSKNIYVFADNCSDETLSAIREKGIEPVITSLGNSASWRFIVEFAIKNFDFNSYVYLIEDDYLHLSGALTILFEGLAVADYVTLYDHPDKYINFKQKGTNPYVKNGGELSRVIITQSTHWKHTNSTTMSFAAKVKTLAEDKYIWWLFTSKKVPFDFFAFQILGFKKIVLSRDFYKRTLFHLPIRLKPRKKRVLISPIPGFATHAELKYLSPITVWHNKKSWCDM